MLRAVIFDMDGVISDTQKFHETVEMTLLRKHGIDVTHEEIESYTGVSDKEFFEGLFRKYCVHLDDIDAIIREKWDMMLELARRGIQPIPGALELINKCKNHNLKLGVASASPPEFIKLVLSELGIENLFDAVTSSHEVERGKPEPDVFILTAKRLGVLPRNCVVIEDGINGMLAAKKAGMKCIALAKDTTKSYPADLVVERLANLSFSTFTSL
ncbi:MAG: HAD family phosphatase [Candidatus Diapherotrites archaeon]|nr:HAD family phosphatase [Candidatus Diapherotrites archaeon]